MRIDSQGYASVIIPDHTDDAEPDCLKSGESECPFHSTLNKDQILFPPGPPLLQPSDYEVPVHVPANGSESNETKPSAKTSPRLSRQRAVLSESEDDKQIPGSRVEGATITTQTLSVDPVDRSGRYDRLLPPPATEVIAEGDSSLIKNLASDTTANQASVESAIDKDSEIDIEDVFDSSIEDTRDSSCPQSRLRESATALTSKPRTISLKDSTVVSGSNQDSKLLRPRAMTVHSTILRKDITDSQTDPEMGHSRSKSASYDTGLHITLNQHSGVTV